MTRAMDDPDVEVASAAVATLNSAEEDRGLAARAVTRLVGQLKTGTGARDKVRAASARALAEFRSHGLARADQLQPVLAALRAAAQPDVGLRTAARATLDALQK
jgi:hypothetical protein